MRYLTREKEILNRGNNLKKVDVFYNFFLIVLCFTIFKNPHLDFCALPSLCRIRHQDEDIMNMVVMNKRNDNNTMKQLFVQ